MSHEAPIFDPELGRVVWDEYTDLGDDTDPAIDRRNTNRATVSYRVYDFRRITSARKCPECLQVVPQGVKAWLTIEGHALHQGCYHGRLGE